MDRADLNGAHQTPTQPVSGQHQVAHHKSKGNSFLSRRPSLQKIIIVIVVVVVIAGAGVLWFFYNQRINGGSTVNKNEFQAVFLSNGQVYFGKLGTVTQSYLVLTDIYYLDVQGSSTNSSTNAAASLSGNAGANDSVQLVKLGNELHGPEDEMTINRVQVLYWENLKPSGKVTQAIDKYQSEQR